MNLDGPCSMPCITILYFCTVPKSLTTDFHYITAENAKTENESIIVKNAFTGKMQPENIKSFISVLALRGSHSAPLLKWTKR